MALNSVCPSDEAELQVQEMELQEAEEAEARGDRAEELSAKLSEDIGALRYALKDLKSFRHRRCHELEAQVRRLEKQRHRLAAERPAPARLERNSAAGPPATAEQLERLRELNKRLIAQAQEANEERAAIEVAVVELRAERDELAADQSRLRERAEARYARLDEISEAEGEAKREARRLQDRAGLLARQLDALEQTIGHSAAQEEEAEISLVQAREENRELEVRSELCDWKLRVATTNLEAARRHRSPVVGWDLGANAASSSA